MKLERTICCAIIIILSLTVVSLYNKRPHVITEVITKQVPVKVVEEVVVEVEKQVEVEVEVEVIKEVPVYKAPPMKYNVTSEEREMLARLVYLEANIESLDCQKAIVSVVFNRLHNGAWGDTLEDVIYYPNQFSPASLIPKTTPTEKNYEAVDYVLQYGVTVPYYVMYFRAGYHFKADGYVPYTTMDRTYFGYFTKDKK